MIMAETLRKALDIIHIMKIITPSKPDSNPPEMIVHTFRNGKVSGLAISNDDTRKRVNVFGHPVSDGYRIVYGSTDDFDFDSGQAKDSAQYSDFNHDETKEAAFFAFKFLTSTGVSNGTLSR